MALENYAKRRHFNKTIEPKPIVKKSSGAKLIYSIQKHFARNLHYDLRLEFEGVLKSWAMPKGPPLKQGEKRLAVQTEDHPIDYWNFEGEIPEGEYGAGKVEVWDSGKYEIIDQKENKWIIDIQGKKLKGKYVLVQFKGQEKNWLFFKKKEGQS